MKNSNRLNAGPLSPSICIVYKPIGLCATRSADILILTNGTCDMYCVTACWRKSCSVDFNQLASTERDHTDPLLFKLINVVSCVWSAQTTLLGDCHVLVYFRSWSHRERLTSFSCLQTLLEPREFGLERQWSLPQAFYLITVSSILVEGILCVLSQWGIKSHTSIIT